MANTLGDLQGIITELRGPNGCPWDKEQTLESLTPYIIEEAYELVDAIESAQPDAIIDELSDHLLHVVMLTQLSQERYGISLTDVITHCCQKMIRRHPHVFGDKKAESVADVMQQWESIKQSEQSGKSVLHSVPANGPSLQQSQKIQKKITHWGLNPVALDTDAHVWQQALLQMMRDHSTTGDNLGPLLWAVVSICEQWDISAEDHLRSYYRAFIEQCNQLEPLLQSKPLSEWSVQDQQILWDHLKKRKLG